MLRFYPPERAADGEHAGGHLNTPLPLRLPGSPQYSPRLVASRYKRAPFDAVGAWVSSRGDSDLRSVRSNGLGTSGGSAVGNLGGTEGLKCRVSAESTRLAPSASKSRVWRQHQHAAVALGSHGLRHRTPSGSKCLGVARRDRHFGGLREGGNEGVVDPAPTRSGTARRPDRCCGPCASGPSAGNRTISHRVVRVVGREGSPHEALLIGRTHRRTGLVASIEAGIDCVWSGPAVGRWLALLELRHEPRTTGRSLGRRVGSACSGSHRRWRRVRESVSGGRCARSTGTTSSVRLSSGARSASSMVAPSSSDAASSTRASGTASSLIGLVQEPGGLRTETPERGV